MGNPPFFLVLGFCSSRQRNLLDSIETDAETVKERETPWYRPTYSEAPGIRRNVSKSGFAFGQISRIAKIGPRSQTLSFTWSFKAGMGRCELHP